MNKFALFAYIAQPALTASQGQDNQPSLGSECVEFGPYLVSYVFHLGLGMSCDQKNSIDCIMSTGSFYRQF